MAVMGDEETGSGGNLLKSLFDNPSHQKKPHFLLQFLLLLCLLMLGVLCYSLSSSSLWQSFLVHDHYQSFSSSTNHVKLPPRYAIDPKHGVQPNETTEIPTEPTAVPATTEPTAVPGTAVPGPAVPGPAVPGPAVPGPAVPGTAVPGIAVPGIQYHQGHPHNYHFIIDNKDVCETKNPFLVLMVPVGPGNVKARDAIRRTWGKESLVQGEVVLTLFMLGSSEGSDVEQQQERLREENLQHHDLIQSNFMDSYRNLTIKTLVIMHWLATRCPTAAYAMKIDTDMLLNIDNLVIMLQKPDTPRMSYVTGRLMWRMPVVRSNSSKWYVPVEAYARSRYPPYPLGTAYLFSNDLPRKFVIVSKSISYFNIEDAYIGTCMEKLGIRFTRLADPSQFKIVHSKYDRCQFSKLITYNVWSPKELETFWTDLRKPEPPCADNDSQE